MNVLAALKWNYSDDATKNDWGLPEFRYPNMYIPVDKDAVVKTGRVTEDEAAAIEEYIDVNMNNDAATASEGGMSLSKLISLDMIATNATNGWTRPFYFAMTVPDSYYLGLSPYLRNTGMAYEVSPVKSADYDGYTIAVNTDKMYDNVVNKFRWGGIDKAASADDIYLDETVRRMVTTTRSTMLDLATQLYNEGVMAEVLADSAAVNKDEALEYAKDRYNRARTVLDLIVEKLPAYASPYSVQIGENIGELYLRLYDVTGEDSDKEKALKIIGDEIRHFGQYVRYFQSLSPGKYMTLQRTDRYINDTYFISLIQLYADGGGDAETLLGELQETGINFAPYLGQQ